MLSTSSEPKGPTTVAIEIVLLLLLPPLFMGLALAALSGTENFVPGALIGGIVGVVAASLRREIYGMRSAEQ